MRKKEKIKYLKKKNQYSSIMIFFLIPFTSLLMYLNSTRYKMFILANMILILFYFLGIINSLKKIRDIKKED